MKKGFELIVGDQVVSGAMPNGGVHLFVNQIVDKHELKTELSFSGYDKSNNVTMTWFKTKELTKGDEFTLKVVDVVENSIPVEKEPIIVSDEELIDQKLKTFEKLKKVLEDAKMI